MLTQKDESHFIREFVDIFLVDRRAGGLASTTLDFYSYHLDIFSRLLAGLGVSDMRSIDASCVRACMDTFGAVHSNGGTHALYRTVKVFLNWYERETDEAWRSPMRKVPAPKINTQAIPGISMDDLERLLACCGRDWYGRRDRALFLFLFDTGIRRTECFDLDLADLDLETGAARILHGKGDKCRTVYFGNDTAGALRRYLRGRKKMSGPLFLSREGERLTDSALRGVLLRRSRCAGLKEVPSAHDFRRAFALNMLRNGVDVVRVSRLLGHESLSVTVRYLALVDDDLHAAHDLGSPAARLKKGGPVTGRSPGR